MTTSSNERINELWQGGLLVLAAVSCLWLKMNATKINRTDQTIKTKRLSSMQLIRNMKEQEAIAWMRARAPKGIPSVPTQHLTAPTTRGLYASKSEHYAIISLEWIYPGKRFTKIRPNWLKNPATNRNLELDGYNESLQLAIEYNGEQHDVWPNCFHRTKRDFDAQQKRDKLKRRLCEKHGVALLVIPSWVPFQRIPLAVYAALMDTPPQVMEEN